MFDLSLSGALISLVLIGIVIYVLNRWYRRGFIPDFKSKHVFITGTDSGFGQRLAIALDKLGVTVYAGCYTETGAEQLRQATSQRLKTIIIDITDQGSVDRAKEFIQNDLPPGTHLWGLVNNAGILGNMCFQLCNVEDYRQVMEVNFFGHVRVCDAFVPLVKKAKGRIVNVISAAGRVTVPVLEPYTCSKHAMEPYSDGLRRSLKPVGVHVACLEPGYFKTTNLIRDHMWTELDRKWEILPDSEKTELGKHFLQDVKRIHEAAFGNWPFVGLNKENIVIEAMIHALGAKHPKSRYVLGVDARPTIMMTCLNPDWLMDIMFAIWMWHSRKQSNNKRK